MTAYQLDPGDQVAWGGWAIPQPWCAHLVPGQTVTVEIHGRATEVLVRVVRPEYAIADEVRP